MLIKLADDKSARLAELEAAMQRSGPDAKRAKDDFYRLRAGIKGEQDSAYFIDFDYGDATRNWAVIHDLRLEHKGRVAQIDHVLVNRFLDVYALETKHFNAGVKVTEEGEFLRWNDFRKAYEAMESPLLQNQRHIAVLRDVCETLILPERLGLTLRPKFHSFVMVATGAKVMRPKRFDTSQVIKADQLKERIDRSFDETSPLLMFAKATKLVSSETLEAFAVQLATRHAPLVAPLALPANAPVFRVAEAPPAASAPPIAPAPPPAQDGPRCKACGNAVGVVLYGRYGYYFQCAGCKANTAIRFECAPGHNPKLRKDGLKFYRECAQCGTSALYHQNAGGM